MIAIEEADGLLISAGTVAEALIVAARRNIRNEVAALISGLGFEIVSVTAASASRIYEPISMTTLPKCRPAAR